MHYRAEIVIPPVDASEIEPLIEKAMARFDENLCGEDDEGYPKFWDYYVIGGRWSGDKLTDSLDPETIDAFSDELVKRGVTVSGLQFGKQELQPASQAEDVDKLWREWFPESQAKKCPLFKHGSFADQYKNNPAWPDVMPLKDVAKDLQCRKLIAADDQGKPWFMVEDEYWNGVDIIKTVWDGTLESGLKMASENVSRYSAGYKKKCQITDEWLVVTVDYHS